MITTRFEPRPGEAYGACVDCGDQFASVEEAAQHRKDTMSNSVNNRSHTTRATNPDRVSRIQSHVDDVVSMAISDALDELQGEVYNDHATEEEILEALRWHSDFADAWTEGN